MSTQEQKINRLKALSKAQPLVIDHTPCVVGFDQPENGEIKVLLNDDEYAMVQCTDLISFNEDSALFLREHKYYFRYLIELLESYIAECPGEYKIEREV